MNNGAGPAATSIDRPIFVLGERPAAVQLVRALGESPTICALPPTRLLPDLLMAVDRCSAYVEHLPSFDRPTVHPARWYREVQAAHLRASGKSRTVEFSALSILRLYTLFPGAQFVVVRRLARALPRSRTFPAMALDQILQVDSGVADRPEMLERVLAFLARPLEVGTERVVDISDAAASARSLSR